MSAGKWKVVILTTEQCADYLQPFKSLLPNVTTVASAAVPSLVMIEFVIFYFESAYNVYARVCVKGEKKGAAETGSRKFEWSGQQVCFERTDKCVKGGGGRQTKRREEARRDREE